LTEEERLLRSTAREFASRDVAPGASERDEAELFDRGIFRRMGELGLTGAPLPESVGGSGFSYLGWTLVMEELGAADMATAVTLSVHILSQLPVVTWGTDEQRERWLGPMVTGDALGAFALTEPHAGSDAGAIRTRAKRDGDGGYRLTGNKIWISNAPEADRYLVFASLDPAAGPSAITAFLVEKGSPGFTFGAHERKMGIRSCPAAELVFDNALIPAENRLGGEGEGYRIALSALAEGRISIAAACVGIARSALEQAARYLGERKAFGGPLADQQGLRFTLAEMARDVEAARALTRQAAAAKDRGEPIGEASSLAKWTASDTAMLRRRGLLAGDRYRASDAGRKGRPDLRGHEPDPPADRRGRAVQAPGVRAGLSNSRLRPAAARRAGRRRSLVEPATASGRRRARRRPPPRDAAASGRRVRPSPRPGPCQSFTEGTPDAPACANSSQTAELADGRAANRIRPYVDAQLAVLRPRPTFVGWPNGRKDSPRRSRSGS
jgi:butyryl-CoA dehydrogenase